VLRLHRNEASCGSTEGDPTHLAPRASI
jgi:hypothetical protein